MMSNVTGNDPWLLTYSGRKFWPLDPAPDDVHLEDIAHALSMQCRFNGHTSVFYSVAQHSVLVSHLIEPRNALWGLMHDAAEAYIGDIPTPIKRRVEFGVGRTETQVLVGADWVEERILEAVAEALGLPLPIPDFSGADRTALHLERNALMPDHPDWPKGVVDTSPESFGVHPAAPNAEAMAQSMLSECIGQTRPSSWSPHLAKETFLGRFRHLKGRAT